MCIRDRDKSIEIADKTITNYNLTIDELVNSAKVIIESWTS